MKRIEMRASDLGELYTLLRMYQHTYRGISDELLAEISSRYKMVWELCNKKERSIIPITNARGAGRKSRVTEEEKEKILKLHSKGKTIRETAAETGLSVGYVHKLIHEHKDKQDRL